MVFWLKLWIFHLFHFCTYHFQYNCCTLLYSYAWNNNKLVTPYIFLMFLFCYTFRQRFTMVCPLWLASQSLPCGLSSLLSTLSSLCGYISHSSSSATLWCGSFPWCGDQLCTSLWTHSISPWLLSSLWYLERLNWMYEGCQTRQLLHRYRIVITTNAGRNQSNLWR